MKIDKTLINSYPFTIRPLPEADGGGFAIEYPDFSCLTLGVHSTLFAPFRQRLSLTVSGCHDGLKREQLRFAPYFVPAFRFMAI